MEDNNTNNPTTPPRKRRYSRHNGRWTNPASPLQAARFALKMPGRQLVLQIRAICEGHAGKPCKLDVSKLSDYETNTRRPAIEHITAFCKFYQMSPEDLGLIKWRDEPDSDTDSETATDSKTEPRARPQSNGKHDDKAAQEQLITNWLLRSATSVASVLMVALDDYPLRPNEDPPTFETVRGG